MWEKAFKEFRKKEVERISTFKEMKHACVLTLKELKGE
jgi:hypothetical protein